MDLRQFAEQLERCSQSEAEVRTFVHDFALVRLRYIVRELKKLEEQAAAAAGRVYPRADTGVWRNGAQVAESGIDPEWLRELADPDNAYLHIEVAAGGEWKRIVHYLEMTFLSKKQLKILFPHLSKARRPPRVPREELVAEVRALNRMLRWAMMSGLTWDMYKRYQAHLAIHGGGQNVSGRVGSVGGVLAVVDALNELAPGRVRDVLGTSLPAAARTPVQLYEHLYDTPNADSPRAMLLDNGRAIVFASDPDVAIFQSLGQPYTTARQAYSAWEEVRRDIAGRGTRVHQFAVGEIKTATDPQNLHERLALGSRETREEVRTDRFLMMSVLTKEVLTGAEEGRRRRVTGLANRDVERFSDVFNLYFAWGYDDARTNHAEHWQDFKRRLSGWCGLE